MINTRQNNLQYGIKTDLSKNNNIYFTANKLTKKQVGQLACKTADTIVKGLPGYLISYKITGGNFICDTYFTLLSSKIFNKLHKSWPAIIDKSFAKVKTIYNKTRTK